MSILKNVCNTHTMHLDGDSVLQAIELSVIEMTNTSNTTQEINENASLVLVALGQCHSIQVMDCLLNQLKPNVLPHYMILRTMGALASHNPYATVPFIKPTMSVTIPLLGGVKQDNLRQSYAYGNNFYIFINRYLYKNIQQLKVVIMFEMLLLLIKSHSFFFLCMFCLYKKIITNFCCFQTSYLS